MAADEWRELAKTSWDDYSNRAAERSREFNRHFANEADKPPAKASGASLQWGETGSHAKYSREIPKRYLQFSKMRRADQPTRLRFQIGNDGNTRKCNGEASHDLLK
eukprot:GHVT01033819.1.p3 GENE.GHVT01033819.1~~GHVT01033819.1.p3  ORF type:complete len:106 (+),score=14.31 GHVT01033819.1:103-420(+)